MTTWNTADHVNMTFSNGNLTATGTSSAKTRATTSKSTGKWYFEAVADVKAGTSTLGIGWANGSWDYFTNYLGENTQGFAQWDDQIYYNNTGPAQTFAQGDRIGVAFDADNERVWFRVNGGNWNLSGTADPATNTGGIDVSASSGPWMPALETFGTGNQATANFGATAFTDAIPSGFSRIDALSGAVSGTGAATLTVTASGTGTHTPPDVTGTGAATLALTASGSGTHTAPTTTGTGAATLTMASVGLTDELGDPILDEFGRQIQVSGGMGVHGVAGTAAATLAITGSGSGTVGAGATVTGTGDATLALTASASGAHGVSGTAAAVLQLGATASGAHGVAGAGSASLIIVPDGVGTFAQAVTGTGAAMLSLTAAGVGRSNPGWVAVPVTSGIWTPVPITPETWT